MHSIGDLPVEVKCYTIVMALHWVFEKCMKIRSNKTKDYGIDGCENRRKPGITVCKMTKMGYVLNLLRRFTLACSRLLFLSRYWNMTNVFVGRSGHGTYASSKENKVRRWPRP